MIVTFVTSSACEVRIPKLLKEKKQKVSGHSDRFVTSLLGNTCVYFTQGIENANYSSGVLYWCSGSRAEMCVLRAIRRPDRLWMYPVMHRGSRVGKSFIIGLRDRRMPAKRRSRMAHKKSWPFYHPQFVALEELRNKFLSVISVFFFLLFGKSGANEVSDIRDMDKNLTPGSLSNIDYGFCASGWVMDQTGCHCIIGISNSAETDDSKWRSARKWRFHKLGKRWRGAIWVRICFLFRSL